ncbi:hypothetical protein ACUSIJ_08175 [Pseudochelatococcus sp. B33]
MSYTTGATNDPAADAFAIARVNNGRDTPVPRRPSETAHRAHFDNRAVVAGSAPSTSFAGRRLSGPAGDGQVAAQVTAQVDAHAATGRLRAKERRRAFSEATPASRTAAEAFHAAAASAWPVVARYRIYAVAAHRYMSAESPSATRSGQVGRQQLMQMMRILDYFAPLRHSEPRIAVAHVASESRKLVDRLLSGTDCQAAELRDSVRIIEDNAASAASARHIRESKSFRTFLAAIDAGSPVDIAAPEADGLHRMSGDILIDYVNAIGRLQRLAQDSRDDDALLEDFVRAQTPPERSVPAGRSGPRRIPFVPESEKEILRSSIDMALGDEKAISRFSVGRKDDLMIDGERLLLTIGTTVAEHTRALLPESEQ